MIFCFAVSSLSVSESSSHQSENIQISNTLVQLYLSNNPIINIYMNKRVEIIQKFTL